MIKQSNRHLINQNNQQGQNQQTISKSKLNFMKNVRGFGSFLNNSSNYWAGTIQNTLCNCARDDDIIKSEIEESENKNIQSGNNNLFKVTNINNQINDINKEVYTKEWTNEENEILIQQYFKLGNKNLRKLSELIKTKSTQQINYRIKKLELKAKMRSFTRQDDLKIIELVEIYGTNWEIISKNFPDFSAEMLEERYNNKLDPKLKRTKFSEEEDEKIVALYSKYGNNWKEIASYFPDRNANMIKNRFYSFLKKKNNIQGVNSSDKTSSYIESSSIITTSNNDLLINSNDNFKFQYNNINLNNDDIKMDNQDENDHIKNDLKYKDTRIEKILSLNDDFYSNTNIFLNRVNSHNSEGSGNKDLNNPNYFDKFNETYQKIFSSNSLYNMDLNDSNNSNDINNNLNNMSDDDNDNNLLLEKNKNKEKEKLFNQSQKLEEILKKIDSYDYNFKNINSNIIKDNNLFNDLIQKKENLTNYQHHLNNKLQNLKNNYSNSEENIKDLLEINDILLKLISVSKLKIVINKKLNEIENGDTEDIIMD